MPRKRGGQGDVGESHGMAQALARAYDERGALPEAERLRLHDLVRAASEVPLADPEVERIAAILWADRGEGIVSSLESGFKLFEAADEDERARRRRRRSISSLSVDERQALLATLLASRHVPPDSPPHGD